MVEKEIWRVAFDKYPLSDATDMAVNSRSAFVEGVKWAEEHPSDELIMRVLNGIGYEQASWVDFVRNAWEERKSLKVCENCVHIFTNKCPFPHACSPLFPSCNDFTNRHEKD